MTSPTHIRQLDGFVRGPLHIEIERTDGHPGDLYGRSKKVEGPDDLLLSDLLADVLEPFLDRAPKARWVCRGKSRGQWHAFAEVVTYGPAERLGARLLIGNRSLRDFVGDAVTVLEVVCLTKDLEA